MDPFVMHWTRQSVMTNLQMAEKHAESEITYSSIIIEFASAHRTLERVPEEYRDTREFKELKDIVVSTQAKYRGKMAAANYDSLFE